MIPNNSTEAQVFPQVGSWMRVPEEGNKIAQVTHIFPHGAYLQNSDNSICGVYPDAIALTKHEMCRLGLGAKVAVDDSVIALSAQRYGDRVRNQQAKSSCLNAADKNNGCNPSISGTNSNTSPKSTTKQYSSIKPISLSTVSKCSQYWNEDRIADSGLDRRDAKKWAPDVRAAYGLGVQDTLDALDRNVDPNQRPELFKPDLAGQTVCRIDWLTLTFPIGSNERNLKKVVKRLRKYNVDLDKLERTSSPYYARGMQDVTSGYNIRLDYSLVNDSFGTGANRGKATISLPGGFWESLSTREQMELIVFFVIEIGCKVKRIDARMRDLSCFVTPEQLNGFFGRHFIKNGRYPISHIRQPKDPNKPSSIVYHGSSGMRHTSFYIGKNPRQLRIYDEMAKHGDDSIAWELQMRDDAADSFATMLANRYLEQKRIHLGFILSEFGCRNDKWNHPLSLEITDKLELKLSDNWCGDDLNELNEAIEYMNQSLNTEVHQVIADTVLSAFDFYEEYTEKDEHLERLKPASWFTELKELVGHIENIRPHVPRKKSSLQKMSSWRDGSWFNTLITLASHALGWNSRQIHDAYDESPDGVMQLLINSFALDIIPGLHGHIQNKKFKRSTQARILDRELLLAAS